MGPDMKTLLSYVEGQATGVGWERLIYARVKRVLSAHHPVGVHDSQCNSCGVDWPCRTIQLLDETGD